MAEKRPPLELLLASWGELQEGIVTELALVKGGRIGRGLGRVRLGRAGHGRNALLEDVSRLWGGLVWKGRNLLMIFLIS